MQSQLGQNGEVEMVQVRTEIETSQTGENGQWQEETEDDWKLEQELLAA